MQLEPDCQAAIDLAKRAVSEGASRDAGLLLAALYHAAKLNALYPDLARFLAPPRPLREQAPVKVTLAVELRPLFQQFADAGRSISAKELFAAVAASEAGRGFLQRQGAGGQTVPAPSPDPAAADGWRSSEQRTAAIKALDSFGRTLTVGEAPRLGIVQQEATLRALVRILSKWLHPGVVESLVGPVPPNAEPEGRHGKRPEQPLPAHRRRIAAGRFVRHDGSSSWGRRRPAGQGPAGHLGPLAYGKARG
jgi:hypothetical protein